MELLDHMVVLYLIFWDISIFLSIVAAPIYIPTNSAQGFSFLHILVNTCYLLPFFFFFNREHFLFSNFIYLFIYGCVGSSFLCEGFLQLRQAGATLHRGARASHYRDLSCCGAQAPDAQAQQLWLTGPVAPRDVGSSQIRARTHVPCIGRQILNHCATREAPIAFLIIAILTGVRWCLSHCGFDLHFPDD